MREIHDFVSAVSVRRARAGHVLPALTAAWLLACSPAAKCENKTEATVATAPAPTTFADVDQQMQSLFDGYSGAITKIDQQHATDLAKLKKSYDQQLDRLQKFYQDGGSPTGALAVRNEREHILRGKPAQEAKKDGELKAFNEQQSLYLTAKKKLDDHRKTRIADANTKLRKALDSYQVTLTRKGSLDRVAAVAKVLDELPAAFVKAAGKAPLGPPATKEELANYLTGTKWTWDGGKPGTAEFYTQQEYSTFNNASGRRFGRWTYTINDDLEVIHQNNGNTLKITFGSTFRTLKVYHGDNVIRHGRLIERFGEPEVSQ